MSTVQIDSLDWLETRRRAAIGQPYEDSVRAGYVVVQAEIADMRKRLEAADALLHDWREQWGDGAQPSGDLIDSTDAHLTAHRESVP
jgi:transposase-like protein